MESNPVRHRDYRRDRVASLERHQHTANPNEVNKMNNYKIWEFLPDKHWQIVPHVISVNVEINHRDQQFIYLSKLPIEDFNFVLRRIHSRRIPKSIEIINSTGVMYEAPGWLHHDNPETAIEPGLMFASQTQWSVRIDCGWDLMYSSTYIMEFALIGERAIQV